MREFFAVLVSLTCIFGASAQIGRLPQEAAKRYAKIIIEQTGNPYNGPLSTEVDISQPCAEQGEGGGAMVVPDKKLTTKRLEKLGKNVVPIGQLWLRKWTLTAGKKIIPDRSVSVVTVNIDDVDRPLRLFLLGLRRNKHGQVELLVYSKGDRPVQVLPVKKIELIQKLPLELEWARGDGQIDDLTLRILGRYEAVLHSTRH